ncbi:aminodeoxychorismate/anthranilate synthase component II [Gilvimarinus agarilyticus]|uniref:anthranilate synthase component II n=1 Tax=unclassified Gilvimarinus TaxID=2642066 RepID=UPI001C09A407|nr:MULTISPECIES: aminodeoxychorismate/anthranilate synthase component II [unclassified Gilvimarinus]MBU2886450.1 aminodeoxychorismate/anthranilate synthase component II [Gilvimarinus agarilyticus]MDO6571129.1 aminodeoxychorismate/anthranilate synthase component II [Gilvimarinus sp. 2_MG-2023]MDO6745672.1 aminodeoxychorismate/anthranilate synthase component II [Gilvimarinus sp. 1_MG-2023]
MKILIIDNYDSFTYNLYQYIGEILTAEKAKGAVGDFSIVVERNNDISLNDVIAMAPDRIIISPGPGSPDDKAYFGICAEVIAEAGKTIPLLGVCLGMQGITHVFGGKVVKAGLPVHGKTSPIYHNAQGVFARVPQSLEIMRYHSLVADPLSLPECLELTAVVAEVGIKSFSDAAASGAPMEIMGVRHKDYPIEGIQFHPESFATEGGKDLLRNFLFEQER